MERKIFAIIVAGGSGTRMGTSVPKQFLELDGRPILRHTIEKFITAIPTVHIVTVLPHEHIEFWRGYCASNNFNCPQMIVEGGFTRFHSVKSALSKIPDDAIVAVHDGVRPFVSVELIRRMVEGMEIERNLIPVIQVTDTLKALEKIDGRFVPVQGLSFDRSKAYAAQTPQFFLAKDLKSAYLLPFDTSFTDDASVVERSGLSLSYVEGEKYNIKITTPQDLEVAEKLVLL